MTKKFNFIITTILIIGLSSNIISCTHMHNESCNFNFEADTCDHVHTVEECIIIYPRNEGDPRG